MRRMDRWLTVCSQNVRCCCLPIQTQMLDDFTREVRYDIALQFILISSNQPIGATPMDILSCSASATRHDEPLAISKSISLSIIIVTHPSQMRLSPPPLYSSQTHTDSRAAAPSTLATLYSYRAILGWTMCPILCDRSLLGSLKKSLEPRAVR